VLPALLLFFWVLQATLCEVLDKIVSHRIHRVYVVDEAEKPCGVVTCTDVLKLVVQHAHLTSKPNSRAQSQYGDEQQQQQAQAEQQQQSQQQRPVSEADVRMQTA
jgi:signal-transduction protein with cAMP-binding, CBS, and nucleotidyltransferase domain